MRNSPHLDPCDIEPRCERRWRTKKEVPHVNAFQDACAVKIFLMVSRFDALVEILAGNSDYCRRVCLPQ